MLKYWLWLFNPFLSAEARCRYAEGTDKWQDMFHDYPDGEFGEPWHFYTHECKRCGKEFII